MNPYFLALFIFFFVLFLNAMGKTLQLQRTIVGVRHSLRLELASRQYSTNDFLYSIWSPVFSAAELPAKKILVYHSLNKHKDKTKTKTNGSSSRIIVGVRGSHFSLNMTSTQLVPWLTPTMTIDELLMNYWYLYFRIFFFPFKFSNKTKSPGFLIILVPS